MKGSDTMKYAPMTRCERRGEDPREASSLRSQVSKIIRRMQEIKNMDARELQQVLWSIRRKKG